MSTAEQIIALISNQSDLLLSLSVAIVSGTVALLVHILITDKKAHHAFDLRGAKLLIFGVILQAISVLMGYMTLGALIDKVPVLMAAKYDGLPFNETVAGSFCSIALIRISSIVQFLSFSVGFAFITIWFMIEFKLTGSDK